MLLVAYGLVHSVIEIFQVHAINNISISDYRILVTGKVKNDY